MNLLINRFLEKTRIPENKDLCWEWIGFRNTKGHGRLYVSPNKYDSAHRVSYEMFIGKIPENLFVLHKCDNPSCVNPQHLFVGTAKDNTQDCIAKKRFHPGVSKGEKNNMSKLTEKQAQEILKMCQEGFYKGVEIAKMFNISQSTVSAIKKKRNWKYL